MQKKYVVWFCNGKRRSGAIPRYVSSAEIVGADIVIHTSTEPVPISAELSSGARSVFMSCSNLAECYEWSSQRLFEFDAECLARSFHSFVDQFGVEAWNNLINDGTLPVQEVSGDEE